MIMLSNEQLRKEAEKSLVAFNPSLNTDDFYYRDNVIDACVRFATSDVVKQAYASRCEGSGGRPITDDDAVKAAEKLGIKSGPTLSCFVDGWNAHRSSASPAQEGMREALEMVLIADQNNPMETSIFTAAQLKQITTALNSSKDGWTRIEEGLPEVGEYVLVNVGEDTILKGRLMRNGWVAYFADGELLVGLIRPVTHWKPLPQPPTG